MTVPFPHQYRATISRTLSSRPRVEALPRTSLTGYPSGELEGELSSWLPEHLVLSSLGLCLLTTFEVLAARDGIELLSWRASAGGTVERTPEGLMFTSIVLSIDMEVTGAVDRVEDTLEDAKQYCLVLNSLRVPVVVEAQVRTPDRATPAERQVC
jgi:organic hydroperoxide reductase OsmC/OhrA